MLEAVTKFEEECEAAGVRPVDALIAGGLSRSTWFRWKSGDFAPNLRSLERARAGLEELRQKQAA